MAIESRTSKNFSDFMRMNSHNTDNLMNDYDWEDVVRSKRIVSLDSSAYKKQKAAKRSQGSFDENEKKRSMSANYEPSKEDTLMKKLSFEDVDVVETPLSSLRSCSEYNHGMPRNLNPKTVSEQAPRKKSYWGKVKDMFVGPTRPERRTSILYSKGDGPQEMTDETRFFLRRLQFDEANLVEGEDYMYSTGKRDSTEIVGSAEYDKFFRQTMNDSSGKQTNSTKPRTSSTSHGPLRRKPVPSRRTSSTSSSSMLLEPCPSPFPGTEASLGTQPTWLDEANLAIDYVFGVKVKPYSKSMEVELTTIRDYQLSPPSDSEMQSRPRRGFSDLSNILSFTLQPAQSNRRSRALSSFGSYMNISEPPSLERVLSWRSMLMADPSAGNNAGIGNSAIADFTSETADNQGSENLSGMQLQLVLLYDTIKRSAFVTNTLYWADSIVSPLRAWHRPPGDTSDDFFFETITLQPYSSSAYLRGMLLSGTTSLCFNLYNVTHWSSMTMGLQSEDGYLVRWLYLFVLTHTILNFLKLPFQLVLQFQCWESSRANSSENSIEGLRDMILSDTWMLNNILGRICVMLGLANVVVAEIYLWMYPRGQGSDELRSLVVALTATTLLTLTTRVYMSIAFSFSLSDPQLTEKSERVGLTKEKIDSLKTFVFTDLKEVNNDCCSICLSEFDIGEMLICLPCDQNRAVVNKGLHRTDFHATVVVSNPSTTSSPNPCPGEHSAAHSFHAACIREWLKRQNSCPLCQKIV